MPGQAYGREYFGDEYTLAANEVEFIHPDKRIGFSLPCRAYRQALDMLQYSQATAGNVSYGYEPVTSQIRFTLEFPLLPESEILELLDFFENVCKGQTDEFTLYDWRDLSSRTVMFGSPRIKVTWKERDHHQVSLDLLELP